MSRLFLAERGSMRALSWPPRGFWNFVANFGDLGVLGPTALAVFVVLLVQRRRADALAWAAGFGLCFLLTLTLKATFGSFQVTLLDHTFNAKSFPSGHVSHGTAFYGGLAVLVTAAWRGWAGRLLAAALAALVVLIAFAVFVLGWHHSLDIVVGFLVGAGCVVLMQRCGLARPRGGVQLAVILATVAVLVGSMHGLRLDDHIQPFRFAAALPIR
jgi:membrane-associated phospholipid phosphatase